MQHFFTSTEGIKVTLENIKKGFGEKAMSILEMFSGDFPL